MDFPDCLPPAFFLSGSPGLDDAPDVHQAPAWSACMELLRPPAPREPTVNPQQEEAYVTKWGRWNSDTPGPLPFLRPAADSWEPEPTSQDPCFLGRLTRSARTKARANVIEQLNQFLCHHGDIAFGPLGMLLQENFNLGEPKKSRKARTVMNAEWLFQDLGGHQPMGCPWAHWSTRQRRFSILGGTVLGKEVEGLLGGLLHEELETRWKKLLDEASTGGSLTWVPGTRAHIGQLVYPTSRAHDQLNFQKVKLSSTGEPQVLGDPTCILLRGPVRQVVTRTIQGEALLAVRSDHHCAVWQVSRQGHPNPLQVLEMEKGATGISLSPHLPGELAVCTRSGAVCLWSPQDGLQQIHKDPKTLVFKDPSSWRWADFTAHPRMLTIADRTGVKLTDVRAPSDCGKLLFRVGAEASCQRGERVLLAQYLGTSSPLSPTLHLICTQFSLYLLDERLPLVPMLKWNHTLMSLPLLGQLLPPPCPGAPLPLILGGQGGHLRLLNLSGGPSCALQLAAPPQSLPSLMDSLPGFPVLEPHGQQLLQNRLKAPLTGLAAVVPPSCPNPTMLLFQLSAAGDVFYQRLRLQPDASAKNAHSLRKSNSSTDPSDEPSLDSHDQTSAAPSSDTTLGPSAVSWNPRAVACCRRWLKTLMQIPPTPPLWTPPTFSQHRHHIQWVREEDKGKVREGLQAAMTEGRLLQQGDLGPLPPSDPPPAHEPSNTCPEDKLNERLEAFWEGKGASWWNNQQGGTQKPRKRPSREKRRTQLSSSFSSARTDSDFDISSSAGETLSPLSRMSETSQSLELTQEPWAQNIPQERRQTVRDYLAILPSLDSESCSTSQSQNPSSQTLPSSQPGRRSGLHSQNPRTQSLLSPYLGGSPASSSQNPNSQTLFSPDPGLSSIFQSQNSSIQIPSSRHTPSLAGSQQLKKKPRMGF
ncbi:TATA box-binding protein-associated factor RNA polymerase I subunit C [Macrotis lagotis]|uniref:TATA box-binding protein-associated factor RNA polymerase I subunit C n=1 Tax=Macrotis lagotis TaxID=92651 RepID=UPI003D69EA15